MRPTRKYMLCAGFAVIVSSGWVDAAPEWVLWSETGPAPRSNHAMVYDSCRNVVVMYGGVDEQQAFEETWEWDGVSWTLRASGGGPGIRFTYSMAFDAARCRTVLFGGNDAWINANYRSDTWEWDGNTWAQKCSDGTCGPTMRHAGAMAYHPLRQRVVLFGGWSSSNLLNDVWAWDGTTWTSITTNSGPTPRSGAAMVYDPLQDRMVVFGGNTVPVLCGTHSNEMWELELPTPSGPGTWTLQTVSASPSPRALMGMAFDASTGKTLLYGGTNDCDTAYHDTWSYNGSSWQLLQAQSGPGNLYWFGMAFDTARAETVLFGGDTTYNPAIPPAAEHFKNETWTFGGPPPGRPSGRLMYQTEYPSQRFHIRDLATDAVTTVQLPPMGNGYYNPQWCRTGEWITFMCADVVHETQICVSRPDGSEFAQITSGSGNFVTPGFSGDCSRIVFHGVYGHAYVINRDGSNWTDLGVSLGHTRWSPIDNRIAGTDWGFTYDSDIFILDMDQGTTTQITHHAPGEYFNYAYWSPDGTKLVVAGGVHGGSGDIFVMNSDGSDLVNLTGDWTDSDEGWPAWSGDGTFIIFSVSGAGLHNQTWAMLPDGTERINLSNSPDQDEYAPAITGAAEGCAQAFVEDFSADPGWTTDQPGNYYWDATAGAFHAKTNNAPPGAPAPPPPPPTRYAYTTVDYDGGSIRLEFDLKPIDIQWSAGVFFGLFDENLVITPWVPFTPSLFDNFYVAVARADGGPYIEFDVCKAGACRYDQRYGVYSDGTWYHFVVQYDTATDAATLAVTERDTHQPVVDLGITNVGGLPVDLDRLGFARDPAGSTCPNARGYDCSASATALLDNVTLFNCTGGTGGCITDAECDDGLACNGLETCQTPGANGHCVGGTPVNCDDQGACTSDTCVEPAGTCEHSSNGTCGACCNTLAGTCTDNRVQADCLAENAAQRVWTMSRTCGEVACDAVLGACCDHDPFGGCTSTTLAQCQGGKLEWTKLASCANINCDHAAIPTVSEWGLVVLTLLLLTGAKVYFGGRRVPG